jgi:hypothetical protein
MKIRALLALTLASLATCDSGPQAGEIVFELSTPYQDDGAVQFRVTSLAPEMVDAVAAACVGCRVFVEVVSQTEIRGVLVGDVVPGAALRVTVSDRKARAAYAAEVVAVASRTYVLRAPSGYVLTRAD